MQQLDLFTSKPVHLRGKHYIEPRGYYAPPGTGPLDQTCRTCAHYITVQVGAGRTVPKCGKVRPYWSHTRRTDILIRMPACKGFELRTEKSNVYLPRS